MAHKNLSICHLEALNAVVAIKVWVPSFTKQLVHLSFDNATAVAILQVGRGNDSFLQSFARGIWLTCAAWDITLAVGHVSGASLADTVDALSCWHLGQNFKDKVQALLCHYDISCISVLNAFFLLSNDL